MGWGMNGGVGMYIRIVYKDSDERRLQSSLTTDVEANFSKVEVGKAEE